ncbi:MAG: heme-degrading monooxygenase HmoA [Polaribacter sp.]
MALPDYCSTHGNQGAYVLHRIEGSIANFNMLTFWDDLDSIKNFAGEDYEKPKIL